MGEGGEVDWADEPWAGDVEEASCVEDTGVPDVGEGGVAELDCPVWEDEPGVGGVDDMSCVENERPEDEGVGEGGVMDCADVAGAESLTGDGGVVEEAEVGEDVSWEDVVVVGEGGVVVEEDRDGSGGVKVEVGNEVDVGMGEGGERAGLVRLWVNSVAGDGGGRVEEPWVGEDRATGS